MATDVFFYHRVALRLYGVTLPGDVGSRRWLLYLADFYLVFAQVCSLAWTALLFRGAYLYTLEDFMNRVIGVTAGVSLVGSVTKFYFFRTRNRQLKELMDELTGLPCDTERGRLVMKVVKFYVFCVLMIILTHNLHPLYEPFHRTTPYYTRRIGGPWQEVLPDYAFGLYAACVVLPGNVIGDTLFLLLASQLSHRLYLLAKTTSRLGATGDLITTEGTVTDESLLRSCIQEHNHLIRLKEKLQDLFSIIILGQLLYSFMDTCITLFAVSQAKNMAEALKELLPQFISLFLEIFLYCWGGEMINTHFGKLHKSTYESDWYNAPPRVRSSLLVMQTFTSKPVDIQATIFKFNFKFYETICRETFSYYTIMYQFFNQKK
uniref:Odorant receptor n=1 Tax=Yemma signatus TaxID=300820 RepID=A0A385H600_9HEMI|nr:odorant receptor [Yemma signatus]